MDESAFVFGNNKSVLVNTTVPLSTIKEKMNSLLYYFIHDRCAREEWRIAHINTYLDSVYLLMKFLPAEEKRTIFIQKFLHWLEG